MLASEISAQKFGRMFMQWRRKFSAIAQSYVHDSVAAEDIVSECFLSFWSKRAEIELKTVPEAYILQSVKNRCLNWLRDRQSKLRREQHLDSRDLLAVEAEISALEGEDFGALFSAEVEKIFKDRLATFPALTRDIFLSSRFDGMTYDEIAAKYGVSPRKVKREIQRVLADIRIALQDYLPLLLVFLPQLFDRN